jgi:hypothetical protein
MLRVLAAYLGGDRQICSMVRSPHPTKRTPNARTASASTWYRSEPGMRTVSSRSWRPRASGVGHRCARGIVISPRCGPATGDRCPRC